MAAPAMPPQAPAPLDEATITRLVHGFYADVRADALLGPVFAQALGDDWEPHLARMVDFWSTIALGSRRFRGSVMGKHLPLPGITPAHFAAWVGLWKQHTDRLCQPADAERLQQAAHGVARQLFTGMLGKRPPFEAGRPPHAH